MSLLFLPLSLSSSIEILRLCLPLVELNVYSCSPRTFLTLNVPFFPSSARLFL